MNTGKATRALVVTASLMLGLAFAFPLWQIDIDAPQYPEGLSMLIGIDRMSGSLNQINILNHYIGMKHITPSAIPELRIMPLVLLGLIGLGLLAGAINRRWALITWLAVFASAGLAGLYDFYAWCYDYGHNLNPDAPIKIAGMTYDPPVIGHKTLLNIEAYSYPHVGGVAIGLAMALGLVALYLFSKKDLAVRKDGTGSRGVAVNAAALNLLAVVSGVGLSGCNGRAEAIQIGSDTCDTCKMTISDSRFGGEVVTSKGRVLKFDSVTCLMRFYSANPSQAKSVYVSDFVKGGLIDARSARYLRTDRISGTMGPAMIAVRDQAEAREVRAKLPGEWLGWNEVQKSSR